MPFTVQLIERSFLRSSQVGKLSYVSERTHFRLDAQSLPRKLGQKEGQKFTDYARHSNICSLA
jgi:hypothetical protein